MPPRSGLLKRRPSAAIAIAVLAAVIAMTGTGYAAFKLARGSVGSAQLAHDAVTSAKVKNRKLSARDFAAATRSALVGPEGAKGDKGPRGAPGNPGSNNTTPGPSDAYGAYHDAAVPVGTTAAPLAGLTVPAGSYFVRVKAQVAAGTANTNVTCTLT